MSLVSGRRRPRPHRTPVMAKVLVSLKLLPIDTRVIRRVMPIATGPAKKSNKGLYVVTLPAAQALTLEQIAEGRRLRTERVLHGKATLEDLGKPSFTVSNLGPMGVETFNPLLMPPQVGILGVGTVRSTPTEDRLMLSLTFDHRVIDGAPAAGALKQVKEGLEFPGLLL